MVTVLSNSILVTMRFVIAVAICFTGTTTKSHGYAFSSTQGGVGTPAWITGISCNRPEAAKCMFCYHCIGNMCFTAHL